MLFFLLLRIILCLIEKLNSSILGQWIGSHFKRFRKHEPRWFLWLGCAWMCRIDITSNPQAWVDDGEQNGSWEAESQPNRSAYIHKSHVPRTHNTVDFHSLIDNPCYKQCLFIRARTLLHLVFVPQTIRTTMRVLLFFFGVRLLLVYHRSDLLGWVVWF